MEWKDVSSYSQSKPRGTREPTAWEIQTDSLRITVVYGHIYYPGEWIMFCRELDMKDRILIAKTAKEAQNEAIEMVKSEFSKLKWGINTLIENNLK